MPETGQQRPALPLVAGEGTVVLILGAFPGEESLRRQQYYAHPRNLFWDMMGEICGAGRDKSYPERLAIVMAHGIALWDVLASCARIGSMDADIRPGAFTVNDFRDFLSRHPVRVIFFDGQKAGQLFRRHVLPLLEGLDLPELIVLPSTSPAHAAMTRQEKLHRWLTVQRYLPGEGAAPTPRWRRGTEQ